MRVFLFPDWVFPCSLILSPTPSSGVSAQVSVQRIGADWDGRNSWSTLTLSQWFLCVFASVCTFKCDSSNANKGVKVCVWVCVFTWAIVLLHFTRRLRATSLHTLLLISHGETGMRASCSASVLRRCSFLRSSPHLVSEEVRLLSQRSTDGRYDQTSARPRGWSDPVSLHSLHDKRLIWTFLHWHHV